MKKFVTIVLSAALAFGLSSCTMPEENLTGSNEAQKGSAANSSAEDSFADEILNGEISGEITISAFDSVLHKNFLDEAAQKFKSKYPNTEIVIDIAGKMPEVKTSTSGEMVIAVMDSGGNSQEQADYITKINTEMMSGGGADLYLADAIPFQKYADSGQLVDMLSLIEHEKYDKAQWQYNIIEGVRYNGGQYILPIAYDFDYVTYDKEMVTDPGEFGIDKEFTFDELLEMGGQIKESLPEPTEGEAPIRAINSNESRAFNRIFYGSYEKYVNSAEKKANFNDGDFANILTKVEDYVEKGYINEQGFASMAMGASMITIAGAVSDEGSGDVLPLAGAEGKGDGSSDVPQGAEGGVIKEGSQNEGSLQANGEGNVNAMQERLEALEIGGMALSAAPKSIFATSPSMALMSFLPTGGMSFVTVGIGNETHEIGGLLVSENRQAEYSVSTALAMNSNSKNKALAWAFIEFLMSEEAPLMQMRDRKSVV